MNGNNPHAGRPEVTQAGKRSQDDLPELSTEKTKILREEVASIASRTRRFLPDEYVVNANVRQGVSGPRATVAVQPPVGNPVSTGFSPDIEELQAAREEDHVPETDAPEADDEWSAIDVEDQDEVAQGLAASAALQVKQSIEDDLTPTAR